MSAYSPTGRRHQQYLAKNPYGYCPDHSTGVSCPVGLFGSGHQEPTGA
jgi:peptide-methionine (S)-S-oxide reductase